MEEKVVSEFCSLLPQSERGEVLSLLLEYAHNLDKLAFLFNRAEEYKLVLRLSQKQSSEYLSLLQKKAYFSVAVGAAAGVLSALLISCL